MQQNQVSRNHAAKPVPGAETPLAVVLDQEDWISMASTQESGGGGTCQSSAPSPAHQGGHLCQGRSIYVGDLHSLAPRAEFMVESVYVGDLLTQPGM
jgi:hypothetical protein